MFDLTVNEERIFMSAEYNGKQTKRQLLIRCLSFKRERANNYLLTYMLSKSVTDFKEKKKTRKSVIDMVLSLIVFENINGKKKIFSRKLSIPCSYRYSQLIKSWYTKYSLNLWWTSMVLYVWILLLSRLFQGGCF